jgi:predicted transcriptional regulator
MGSKSNKLDGSTKAASLGPLQRRVLEHVWDNPGCTARDVLEALNASGGKEYAYTTIKTVLDALHAKKLVARRRVKTAYHFTARTSKLALLRQRLGELFGRLGGEPAPVASSLVDYFEDDPEQLSALIDELKKRGLY